MNARLIAAALWVAAPVCLASRCDWRSDPTLAALAPRDATGARGARCADAVVAPLDGGLAALPLGAGPAADAGARPQPAAMPRFATWAPGYPGEADADRERALRARWQPVGTERGEDGRRSPVPVPASGWLLASALAGFLASRRRCEGQPSARR